MKITFVWLEHRIKKKKLKNGILNSIFFLTYFYKGSVRHNPVIFLTSEIQKTSDVYIPAR